MDFGMPTLIELETLGATTDLCTQLGLDFIELNMNMPQYQLHALQPDYLRRLQNKHLYFTLHLDENINVWDFNPLVAKAYMDTMHGAIELALATDIPIINMHMHNGVSFTLPDKKVFLYEQYNNWYMEKTRSLRELCERTAAGSNLKICIENCNGYTTFQQEAIAYLLQSDVFFLTLDIGHHYTAGLLDDYFIQQHSKKLCHVHLHDATSTRNHLALGTGEVDIHKTIDLARNRKARCVIETKNVEGLHSSVEWLKKHSLHR